MNLSFFKDNYSKKLSENFSSRSELYINIKKKSVQNLWWIIGVTLLKLTFFIISGIILEENTQLTISPWLINTLHALDLSLLILPAFFSIINGILIFRITSKNTFEALLQSIKRARNYLKLYISLVLVAYLCIIYITIYWTIVSSTNDLALYDRFSFYASLILTCVVSTILILLILWGVYKILYSRFLKRLNIFYNLLKDAV